jgi:hypothetical protein
MTVFVFGLVYRKPLTDAIQRMTEIQGPGMKASFRNGLDSVAGRGVRAGERAR